MKHSSLLFLLLVFVAVANAGNFIKSKKDTVTNTFNKDFVYEVKKSRSAIIIDGIIEEKDWMLAQKANTFYRVLPVDTGFAYQKSEIMLTYDDKALYLAQIFHDTIPGKRIMESFRRDFSFGNNDNLLVFFDTFLDQTNGFSFGVSASGAKWDGLMHSGGSISLDWDCKWESKTKHYDNRWVSEMRIPFKSVRYPKGSRQWNTNFSRLDLKSNEKSSWAPVPRQFPTASLAYTGVMKFDEPLPKPSTQISLIPYVFGSFANDYENGKGAEYRKDFGFDAKVGISSSLNLDLTYNPDFAQVEVDQQVTNIDRFELFFPEKRQFFLENSDLFSGFGNRSVTPFFSRRIGLDAPVLAGARLSGKIGNDWRIGLMNMATQKTGDYLARNFTVASVQRKIFARSNIGFIAVNKEYLEQPSDTSMFNRVIGIDYNLASKNNFWGGKFYYHRSFQPGNPDKQFFLENSDLFSGFGNRSVTPFFSRRIGLDAPVLAGARLSGKIGNDWRIGLMNMATQKTGDYLARNFTVASVQRKIFARSNIGFIAVNKEYLEQPSDTSMFNRVIGIDYNLASKNNFWGGKFYYHRSFQPGNPDKQFSQGASLSYQTKNLQLELVQNSVGENFRAETGYVQRTGYNFISPEFTYLFVPNERIVSHGVALDFRYYYDPGYHKIDHENSFAYQFEFQNRSQFNFGYVDFFVELQDDFDPTHSNENYLPAKSSYNFGGAFLSYQSTRKTMFNWTAEAAKGTFYSGNIQYLTGQMGYRFQPFVNLSMNFNYTDMDLGNPFERTKFLLFGPKMDVTFTDKLFWSTFVQYNEQIDNMNINMRLQWRYQPVSDIYLVYTDNYIPGSWNSRNRALVLKMTYWLN